MFERFGQDLILLERLAAGGMGEVYRAKQLGKAGFDKTVAVKMILPHYAARPEFKAMFEQEMRICARLQHPNVAQVFTTGEWNGYLYLVMEFLDGKTVKELINRCQANNTPISAQYYSLICSEVARGISYAHGLHNEATGEALKLVHRDISPQNIMIGYNGEVKILDFGVAKAADSLDLTKPGDLKGNLAYVSPEAIEALPLDGRADIFSLGAVAFELVSLHKLFAGNSTFETINNVMSKDIPSLSSLRPDVNKEIEQIILKSLERDRDDRYSSAEELHRDLSKFISRNFPDLVGNDLGRFLSEQFVEERKETENERKHTNDLWLKTKSSLRLEDSSLSNSFNSYTGNPSSFSSDQTTAGLSGFGRVATLKSPSYRLMIRISLSICLLISLVFVLWKSRVFAVRPSPIAWFKPELIEREGPVSSWPSSGNAALTATQPEEDRRPMLAPLAGSVESILAFDGINDFLLADQVALDLRSKRVVTVVMALKVKVLGKQNIWALHQSDKNTDLIRTYVNAQGSLAVKWGKSYGSDELAAPHQNLGQMFILTTIVRPSEIEMFINGNSVLKTLIPSSLKFSSSTYFSLGQDYDNGIPGDFLNGEIGDVVVVPDALETVDRRHYEKLLMEKFGIASTH